MVHVGNSPGVTECGP